MCAQSSPSDCYGVVAETSGFWTHERIKCHDDYQKHAPRRHSLRPLHAASGAAIALGCLAAAPALAAPGEPRQVHVEGHLLPVEESPGAYRVTGGLVGTYKLRTERLINTLTYFGTQIREIAGTESINGCVDQNQNASCDAGERAGEFRLTFTRVASFDTGTGRLMKMRDIPVGNSNEILSTYEGDLQVGGTSADSMRAN